MNRKERYTPGGGGGGYSQKKIPFSLPYLLPGQKFDILFMTTATGAVALNITYEGLLLMVLSMMTKTNIPNSRQEC